jgi:predicted phage terminase large subunit-like protein
MTYRKKPTEARSTKSKLKTEERIRQENDIDTLPVKTQKILRKRVFKDQQPITVDQLRKQEAEDKVSKETHRKYNDIRNALKDYTDKRAHDDFLTFVRKEAPKIVPDFKMGRHIEVLCYKLQQAVDVGGIRLMVFLPPRSTKSVICSKLFPAWYIGRHPSHEIMSVSHSHALASDFGRSVRDLVNSEDFDKMFHNVRLRADVKAAGRWQTNKGGAYYAAGVGSQIAGRGANIALLDDVMSEEDAVSETGRKSIKEWYPSGLRTRVMPNGSIIIINTRYHFDDICGWLLKQEQENEMTNTWDVLRIPAWLDEPAAKLLGLPVGSSYFPEWKPDAILRLDEEEIKASNGSRYWNALYMQDPQPDEGGIVKKKWFKRWEYEDPPECEFVVQTYDTAFSTKDTADNSVIQTWGVFITTEENRITGKEEDIGNLILLSNKYGRYEYPDLRRLSKEMFDLYKPDLCIIEKKASGQSLIQELRLQHIPILEYLPDRDKISRVYAASPYIEAGRVYLPKTEWADELLTETIQFPNAEHDDMVDCMTMAIMYLRDSWHLIHPDNDNYIDEDEGRYKKKKKGYWSF